MPGSSPILCVGETAQERDAGRELEVVGAPARGLAARWHERGAGGDRLRAGLGDRHRAHADAGGCRRRPRASARRAEGPRRRRRPRCACSMAARSSPAMPGNCCTFPNVDGALVGGASLDAADFWAIAEGAAGVKRRMGSARSDAVNAEPAPLETASPPAEAVPPAQKRHDHRPSRRSSSCSP